MAFLVKNSQCLSKRKLEKLLMHTSVVTKHVHNSKVLTLSSFLTKQSKSHHCSTFPCNKKLFLSSETINLLPVAFLHVSSKHHVPETVHVQQSTVGEGVRSTTDKVLFVDTGPTTDSAAEIIDSAKTDPLSGGGADFFHSVQSTSALSNSEQSTNVMDNIADLSSLSEIASNVPTEVLEPSLASLGLASWYPTGIVQWFLEYLHMNSFMPLSWWMSIVLGTVVARILVMPIFIKAQRNAAEMSGYMPQFHQLQKKFNQARRTGNAYEATKCANEMSKFMKTHNVNPVKNTLIPMLQAPVFLSYFLGIRAMANLPVESMKYGGFSWILDLTIPDPYYIMPLISCSTLYVVLKVGAESGVRMDNMKMARYILTAVPIIIFPFIMHFPSAVLFYWCTNNFLTLGLVLLLKIKRLRVYFGISEIKRPVLEQQPGKKKNFIQDIKESYEDQKVLRTLEDRRRMDEVRFQKAGTGPIPRTYAYDPTKPRPAAAAIAAKTKT